MGRFVFPHSEARRGLGVEETSAMLFVWQPCIVGRDPDFT
jgi:hypothetical protein